MRGMTVTLDSDAVEILRAHAAKRGIPLGEAASDLIRNGSRYQIPVRMMNGLPVFDVPTDFPIVTAEHVRELLDEE